MFIGVDCGTQGTKALVIDGDGRVRGRGHAAHSLIERDSGAREQHPSIWVDAMIAAVRMALSEAAVPAEAIRCLGVSGQQHGLVVLDASGAVIRPAKLWNDTETAPDNERLVAALGGPAAWFETVGIIPLTGYTISKLAFLADREPENFARIAHILLPHDYLNHWLTGRFVAEFGDASGTGFFDVRKRAWAPEVLSLIDGGSGRLAAALPELVAPDAVIGTLTPAAAEALGLTTACLVAAGGGDNMMGAIGTGNVREGVVTISLGTSATVFSYADAPVLDPSGAVAPFCSSTGGWLPLVCTMNATNVTSGGAHLFGRDVGFVSEALEATGPGAGGITMLPFLNGERTPDLPTARGSILGLSAVNMTPDNLMRAMVEGVTFGVLAGLHRIRGDRAPERVFMIGGGARSKAWRQMVADMTGAEIVVPTGDEAGCLGAAIQAIWAYGRASGAGEEIATIADRCVALDPDKTTAPVAGRKSAYDDAFALYRRRLAEVHGVH
ncbi:xylulokinase [Pleomorphomonas koreensis]|uniref:xylulokinase n=1 Tax=Pleomorphomonas koreensis TaxID=257440 RepID=UPI000409EAF6|nr:xylulokinase [Pleomorphomonas koreensis]